MGTAMKLLVVFLFSFLSLLSAIILPPFLTNSNVADDRIVVAIYQGGGTMPSGPIEEMFRWMNCRVTTVSANVINEKLGNFSILCVPGGYMDVYAQDISSKGKENIRNFIRNGGGYFGICGGAYFASENVVFEGRLLNLRYTFLGLFSGTAMGPVYEVAPVWTPATPKVNIVNSTHPITQNGPSSLNMSYNSGPMFHPNKGANATILGRYDKGGQPAIVAFDYGSGRVFLIGTHPEEGRNSWNLINRAVLWLTEKKR